MPDAKDWTWVLERPCPECGLDTQSFSREAVAGMIRANAEAWQDVLAGGGPGDVRHRPSPGVWSALEYGCHVRDVFRLYDERLGLMLSVDDGLRAAAEVIAARFEGVSGDQWQRAGVRSDGARFTVESFARYFIHDPIHHLHDVTGARHAGHAAPET